MKKINLLIVAAYNRELQYLAQLGKKKYLLRKKTAFLTSGIGAVSATHGLTCFLQNHKPSLIVTLNTAGIINTDKFQIGDIVLAKTLTPCSFLETAYTPTFIKTIVTNPKKTLLLSGFQTRIKTARVFCPQEITSAQKIRRQLYQAGHDIETMEAYAYHYVANQFAIPVVSVLGLTNIVGPEAHEQWKKNEDDLSQKMATTIHKLFSFTQVAV